MCAPKVLVLRCLMSCWLPNGVFSDAETYPWWNLSIYSIPAKKRTMNSFLPVLPNSRRKDVQKLLPGWRGDVVIDQRRICGGEAKLIWHRNLIEHMSYCIHIYICIHTCILHIDLYMLALLSIMYDPWSPADQQPRFWAAAILGISMKWRVKWQSRTWFILFWNTCCTGFNTMGCYGHVWIVSIKQYDLYHLPIKEYSCITQVGSRLLTTRPLDTMSYLPCF